MTCIISSCECLKSKYHVDDWYPYPTCSLTVVWRDQSRDCNNHWVVSNFKCFVKKKTSALVHSRIGRYKWCPVWTKWAAMICFSCLFCRQNQHNWTLLPSDVFQQCFLPTRDLLCCQWIWRKGQKIGGKQCPCFSCATIIVNVCKLEYIYTTQLPW